MELSTTDRRLLDALAHGLPLTARPYAALGAGVGLDEASVIARLRTFIESGLIRRFGLIVRHHELGYCANAMTVFDVPDDEVERAACLLAALPFVNLCYRRPRRPPRWPYNLYCMIHGRDRGAVEALIEQAATRAGLAAVPRASLFSRRRFKQTAARYDGPAAEAHP